MALTIDMLLADEKIKGANIDQSVLAQIATLSTNEENTVIARKVGETYQIIDQAVETITGTKKAHGVKTTDFVKTQFSDLKSKADAAGDLGTITAERDNLKTKVKDLEKQIKDGSTDAALKGQLDEAQKNLRQKEADLATMEKSKNDEIAQLTTQLKTESTTNLNLAYDRAADAYFATLTFDQGIPEIALEAIKNDVKNKVRTEKGTPAFDGEGANRKLVFKDSNGAILNNATNAMQPFQFGEFAGDYLKDVIVKDAGGGGGGGTRSGGGGSGSGGGGAFSIAGLKSRTQVTAAIKKHLQAEGIAITDPNYQDKFDELYQTEGVKDLPQEPPRE